jgi:NTP pyrophosphatase (non-canonical NTP hydrolase)
MKGAHPSKQEEIRVWTIQQEVANFDTQRFQSLGPGYLALSLAGEAGELANFVKKLWRQHASIGQAGGFDAISPDQRRAIANELADVMLLSIVFCNHLGLDVEEEIIEKLRIIDERLPTGHYGREAAGRSEEP